MKNIYFSNKTAGLRYRHNYQEKTAKYEFHINDDYEIFHFISGQAKYYIEGRIYNLKPGDTFIMNNREVHRLISASLDIIEIAVAHFDPLKLGCMGQEFHRLVKCFENRKLGQGNLVNDGFDGSSCLGNLFNKMDECIENKNQFFEVMVWSLFLQVMIEINMLYERASGQRTNQRIKYDERTLNILNYINSNITEDICLESISKKFYISRNYICPMFKNSTGFTVGEYITYKRVMKARELIMEGIPVIGACFDSGFKSYSNFFKAFKKTLGFSPKELLQSEDDF